jgi:hypothetical protein
MNESFQTLLENWGEGKHVFAPAQWVACGPPLLNGNSGMPSDSRERIWFWRSGELIKPYRLANPTMFTNRHGLRGFPETPRPDYADGAGSA